VCVRWHDGTRVRGVPRCCTTSASVDCGRRTGRSARRRRPGWRGWAWRDYGRNLEARLADLQERVASGRYRATPSRRAYIPKAEGRLRPWGIASWEDKIVARAVVEVLNAV
jgi:hypothetical protein